MHNLTVEGFAHGNVFRNGSGVAINFDHHRNAPYENLFTNLDVGDGRRLWRSSGRRDRGPHSAVRKTAWNLRHDKDELSEAPHWPQINIIGVRGYKAEKTDGGRWIEPLQDGMVPSDLYDAQLRKRLADSKG